MSEATVLWSGRCYGVGRAREDRIGAAAGVPEPLELDKNSGPIRVHMRKVAGVVEVIGLD